MGTFLVVRDVQPESSDSQGVIHGAVEEVLDGASDVGVANVQPYGVCEAQACGLLLVVDTWGDPDMEAGGHLPFEALRQLYGR